MLMVKSVFITGANAGLGREVARQLAAREDIDQIYLACRNAEKAKETRAALEAQTGRAIYDVVTLDTTDLVSVRSAVSSLAEPVDALVMNAGGVGGQNPLATTPDGATAVFAANVLGHVALLEALIAEHKLTSAVLYVGSEAARGVPKLMIKRPRFSTSSADEFATVIDGSYFSGRKPDVMFAYAQVKYIAALWMAAVARRHPQLRCATVSPGNTTGTEAPEEMPLRERVLMRHVVPRVGPLLGLSHPLETGAQRIIEGITNDQYRGGAFYASKANTIIGPVVDQAEIRPDLRDHTIQDNAFEAIHRFLS
jgi:NAD(P)-dependent dehydrogenase (short-subunit alcohol dehydrogenase family)